MKLAIAGTILIHCAIWHASAQTPDARPSFEAADVHVSAKSTNPNQFAKTGLVRGRYEIKTATMVDLIRLAYGFDADKIIGGPSWLEMDRFDVIAIAPADSAAETQKLMLQSLLEERFGLVIHNAAVPRPVYALTAGKQPQLKPADGKGQAGCRLQSELQPGDAAKVTGNANGNLISLGADRNVQYACHNMTTAAFAAGLSGMMGAPLTTAAIRDETGLAGQWNFELKYALTSSLKPLFDAVEKQLGLALQERQLATPVIVVDKVNRKPSENLPGMAARLASPPAPKEFDVASIKPSDSNAQMSRFLTQPGGRLVAENMSLRFLINRAFSARTEEQVAGLPGFADTDRYDIDAKAPGGSAAPLDDDLLAPMLRALLVSRFHIAYHSEERPVNAYSLVSAKPRMHQADPASRTFCRARAIAGAPPGSRVLTCQNTAMAQFADLLQGGSRELGWPVLDATGIEGGWDFTLTFGPPAAAPGVDADPATGNLPSASEPTGIDTLAEALEKQLGLKLEKHKRPMPIVVIDRIEQKPVEN